MPSEDGFIDPTKSADYIGPRKTVPLWRLRPIRIAGTALAGILAWEAGWAWHGRSVYEVDVVVQMPADGDAWGPDLSIDGVPVRTKLVVRQGFGETWLRLHDPVRVPVRPATAVVHAGDGGKQVVPLNVLARGGKCTVVIDLRGPHATAGACVGTDIYDRHRGAQ